MKKRIITFFIILGIMLSSILPIMVFAEEENNEQEIEEKKVIETINQEEIKEQEINPKKELIEESKETNEIEENGEKKGKVVEKSHVEYKTHVQTYGWQDKVQDGTLSGTEGEAKRMEAIKINLSSSYEGSVEYITYIQTYGWESSFKKNEELSGTVGEGKRLEAIEIRLTGEIANFYDIYYRVHAQTYGWLPWAKNGETSGTIGLAKRLEGIEIKLVEKGLGEKTSNTYYQINSPISYQTHVQNHGWLNMVESGMSGTTKEGMRVEAFQVSLKFAKYSGSIRYKSYIEGSGWEKVWKKNAEISGSVGKSKRIEQIKIELTGDVQNYYDIYYRVHIQGFGWLGWAKNGESAGSEEFDFRIEAIEIKFLEKGSNQETGKSLEMKDAKISYNAHIRKIGNQDMVQEGELSGTVGKGLRMEALTIHLDSNLSGNILYKTYIDGKGWEEDYRKNNELSGTTGEGKGIELIRMKLTEELEKRYDIFYRVHSDHYGWFDWAKNDEITGADCYDIQAIEIRLYLKIDSRKNELPRKKTHIETGFYQENGYTYYKDKNGNQARDWIRIMDKKYFFNSLGVMIGKNVKKVIDVSSWQGNIDWNKVNKEADIDGVIVRIAASAKYEDTKLERNIKAIKEFNIPYGIYIYSYAENQEEGEEYAKFTVELIKKYDMNPKIGIFFDLESNSKTENLTTRDYELITEAYMNSMRENGYGDKTSIYTYKALAEEKFYSPYLFERITWIAQYNHFNTYKNNHVVGWQYSSKEIVPGIQGYTDMSVWFKDF